MIWEGQSLTLPDPPVSLQEPSSTQSASHWVFANIDRLERAKFEVGQLWLDASIRILESRTTYNSNYIHAGNRSVHRSWHKRQNSAIETLILCYLCMAEKEKPLCC